LKADTTHKQREQAPGVARLPGIEVVPTGRRPATGQLDAVAVKVLHEEVHHVPGAATVSATLVRLGGQVLTAVDCVEIRFLPLFMARRSGLMLLMLAGCFMGGGAFLASPACVIAGAPASRPKQWRAPALISMRMALVHAESRRAALARGRAFMALGLLHGLVAAADADAETDGEEGVPVADEVTDRVFLDVKFQGVSAATIKGSRESNLDAQAAGEGRIVIGLFGDAAPKTVAMFK
jgi:hypothetical protein